MLEQIKRATEVDALERVLKGYPLLLGPICVDRSGGYKFQNGTIAQAFQMLGLFIWYLGIWLGNQNDRTNNASNLEPSRARVAENTLHLVGLDDQGTIVLRERLGRIRIRTRLANVPRCLIGTSRLEWRHTIWLASYCARS